MEILISMFVAQLWQVTAVLLLCWLLTALLRRRPRLCQAIWTVGLLKCLIPPVLPSVAIPESWCAPSVWASSRDVFEEPKWRTDVMLAEKPAEALEGINSRSKPQPLSQRATGGDEHFGSWSMLLMGVWFAGVGILFGFVVLRQRRFHQQVVARQVLADGPVQSCVDDVLAQLPGRPIRVVVSGDGLGPAAYGAFHPTIVIPESLVNKLPASQLKLILAHEVTHVRRGDLWSGILQTTVVCLYWFDPVVWIASSRLSAVVERCCDEETVRALKCDRKSYLRSLTATLTWKNSIPRLPVACAARPAQMTRSRMEALMNIDMDRPVRAWIPRLAAIMLALIVVPGALPWQRTIPGASAQTQDIRGAEETSSGQSSDDITPTPDASDGSSDMFMRAYKVLALVGKKGNLFQERPLISLADFDELIEAIQTNIAPETWDVHGGEGRISLYPQNLSLVVSARADVHDAIAKFLDKQRRKHPAESATAPLSPAESAMSETMELRTLLLQGDIDELRTASSDWSATSMRGELTVWHVSAADSTAEIDASLAQPPLKRERFQLDVASVPLGYVTSLTRTGLNVPSSSDTRIVSRPAFRLSDGQRGRALVSTSSSPIATHRLHPAREQNESSVTPFAAAEGFQIDLTANEENAGTMVSLRLLAQKTTSPEKHGLDFDEDKNPVLIERLEIAADRVIANDEALLILANPSQPSGHPATMAIVWRAK